MDSAYEKFLLFKYEKHPLTREEESLLENDLESPLIYRNLKCQTETRANKKEDINNTHFIFNNCNGTYAHIEEIISQGLLSEKAALF